MRITLAGAACLAALLAAGQAGPAAGQAGSIDDLVVASINGEQVTRRHLVARLLEHQGDEALEKMIARTILAQEARRLNVTVTDQDVAAKLAEIQKSLKTEENYRNLLARSRLTEAQHREETRWSLLAQRVALAVTPITHVDLETLDVRLIDAENRAAAEMLIRELDGGANFAQLASTRARDPNLRQAGGRLKPFLRIEMLDVWKAVEEQNLRPAGYTKTPVQLADRGWAVIKLEARLPVASSSASERDRLEAVVTIHRVEQWLKQAREKADVKKNSLDESVVAVVNGEPVTRARLASRLLSYQGEEALERLVNRTLLLQAAKELGVSISDQEVDAAYKEMRARFVDEDQFQAFLTRSNLVVKQLRDELRFTGLMEKVALKESPITDDDLQQYQVRMLEAPTRNEAEKWVKELDEGASFEQMVVRRAASAQARRVGGLLKPFVRVELLDVWRALDTQKVKPGSYTRTPVLLTDNSWALVKLEKTIPAAGLPDGERQRLARIVTRYRVNQWLAQARRKAVVAFPVELSTVIQEVK